MVLPCYLNCAVLLLVEPEKDFFVAVHGSLPLVHPVVNSLNVQMVLYLKYLEVLAFPYYVTIE